MMTPSLPSFPFRCAVACAIAISVLTCTPALAQPHPGAQPRAHRQPAAQRKAQNRITVNPDSLAFLHIGVEQGLSQSFINCIHQDRYGFMWFGTQDGLNFFDGYTFRHYRHDPEDSTSIPSNIVASLIEDRQGNLYIGTTGGGLLFFDRMRFTPIPLPPSLPADLYDSHISALHLDRDGALWIATRSRQIFRYQPDTKAITRFPVPQNGSSFAPVYVRDFMEDQQGRLWVGLDLGGIAIIDRNSGAFRHIELPGTFASRSRTLNVLTLAEDWYGNILIGTHSKGLVILHPNGGFSHLLPSEVIHTIVLDPVRKKIWLGLEGDGACLLDPVTRDLLSLQFDPDNPHSLSSMTVRTVYVGAHGETWIGTTGGGLNLAYARRAVFHLLSVSQRGPRRLTFASVRSIHRTPDGMVWVGGYRGLDVVDPSPMGKLLFSEPTMVPYCMLPCPGSPDLLLIGKEGSGLTLMNWKTRRPVPLRGVWKRMQSLMPPDCRVYAMLYDNHRTMWIGTQHGLFECDLRTGMVIVHQHSDRDSTSLPQGSIRAMHRDDNGTVWMGSDLGGLVYWNPGRRRWETPVVATDPRSVSAWNLVRENCVNAIARDQHGVLWIGTANGLVRFNRSTHRLKSYSTQDGMPNNVVYAILEDRLGALWLSTNRGVSRFLSATGEFRNFDETDGLQNNEFNAVSYYRSDDGMLYFGGIGGVTYFQPENIRFNEVRPPVVFTALRVFNKERSLPLPIYKMREIVLEPEENVFSIDIAALNFYLTGKNQYIYRLEGTHSDWVQLGTQRSITFANLSPGTYILHVKGSNNDLRWNDTEAILTIIILPHLWQTWWFRLLGLLALGFLVGIIIWRRYRAMTEMNVRLEVLVRERTLELEESEQSLREANATREKLMSIIAHDLRGPFAAMLGFSDMLDKEPESLSASERRNALAHLHASITSAYDLLDNILSWSMAQMHSIRPVPEVLHLRDLADDVLSSLEVLARQKSIQWNVQVDPALEVFADRDTLSVVLRNLVSNAIKFSHPLSSIALVADEHDSMVRVRITDTGVGMSEEQIAAIRSAQLNSTRGTRNEKGTGLGMRICMELVQLNQGRMEMESARDRGTTIAVFLPLPPNDSPSRT